MVKVLEKAGCKVHYNPSQTCCGQPAFNSGYRDDARKVACKFMGDLAGDIPIITPSASCAGYIRNYYKDLFPGDTEKVNQFSVRIKELSEFLVDDLKITELGARLDAKATYHDSCAALRECKIKQAPRKLLEKVEGLELIEMEHCETCCGFGGTFAVKFEAISVAMAQQKVQNAINTGAAYIISTDMSCLMQIDGYIKKHELPIRTMHLADILSN